MIKLIAGTTCSSIEGPGCRRLFSRHLLQRFRSPIVCVCVVLCARVIHTPTLLANSNDSPNIVLILTDDQSWVGSSVEMIPGDPQTHSTYFRTPNMERLAAMGMRFTRGYAPAPFCCPTRRSLLIGQTPARHMYQEDQSNWGAEYRQQLSIPRMLKRTNPKYRTAHFGKWDSRFDNLTAEEMGYDISDGLTGNRTGGARDQAVRLQRRIQSWSST